MNVVKAYLVVHTRAQILLAATNALAVQALFYRQVMNMDVKVGIKLRFLCSSLDIR